MLKKIFAAIIAAQLIVVPAQAETKSPASCTKGDVLGTIMIGFVISYVGLKVLAVYGEFMKKRLEEKLKAEQQKPDQPAPDCKL